MTQKTVAVVKTTGNKNMPTCNIVTSGPTTFPTYTQTATPVTGENETIQDSGGTVKGLKTVIVPGYS